MNFKCSSELYVYCSNPFGMHEGLYRQGFIYWGGGGGGGRGEASPQMSIFPPKHFHKIWQNTTEQLILLLLINPRRACAARVTVVVSCVVCLYVCLSAHAILAVRAIKSITKDTIVLSVRFAAILKWLFS